MGYLTARRKGVICLVGFASTWDLNIQVPTVYFRTTLDEKGFATMKRNKWIELYHLALLGMTDTELRHSEISTCITMAQHAMEARRLELENDQEHALERKALDHALLNLRSAILDMADHSSTGRA
jgi:hypothetical protein